MKTTQLLIDEPPLQVLPSLAALVGLNEAIFLQQLHYWLQKATFFDEDGVPWIYNSYEEWQGQFPFWSIDTIKRIALRLDNAGFVHTTQTLNKYPFDRTKWYTIDYVRLHEEQGKLPPRSGQSAPF